jgi:uncharacterized protein with von Willebrand factor type A (vWA) domain
LFIDFFYLLRQEKLNVSLKEWLDLMKALDAGLCQPSLLDFYYLSRTVLVKSEADYDKFDRAFYAFFKELEDCESIPEEVWEWLKGGKERSKDELFDKIDPLAPDRDLEELRQMLEERLQEQKSKHEGGNYWVGTGGTSPLGSGGFAKQGIRIGGEGRHQSALQVARKRDYRDFRQDNILDTRQFQMAFRKLRQFSATMQTAETELDVEDTIEKTADNAGYLKLAYRKPRRNTIKLLILFDSDGSMLRFSRLCSALFQAVDKSNHFSDLKVFYFHNCVYDHLYKGPQCRRGDWVDTEWVLKNYGNDYRLIIVGDAAMAPSELLQVGGNNQIGLFNELPGIQWLERLIHRYPHNIWLNPIPQRSWGDIFGHYTVEIIEEKFPMFELSLDGLEQGIKKLLVNR